MATITKNIAGTLACGTWCNRAIPLVILATCGLLAVQPELRLAVPLLVGTTAAMTMMLALALYHGERGALSWPPAVILGVALLLRLMFLVAPPQLSDDIYRYLWDGSTLLRGINPYAAAPSNVTPPPGLRTVHARINHPEYATIYPPAAQMVFAGGAALGGTITGLKAFLVLFDMVLCALLVAVVRRLEMPVWRVALYAWNPLPVLEIAGSGHVDGAGLTMLMGALCLLLALKIAPGGASRPWLSLLSGALLAGAGLVKLFPLVLAPVLYLLVPRPERRWFVAGFFAALAALLLPFLPHLANMVASLDVYARNWEFAGFAFSTLRTLTGSGTTARIIISGLFLMIVAGICIRSADRIGATASPVDRGRRTVHTCYAIAMAFLLLTPTLQPWYALSLAVFLPLCAGPAGLVLCWVVFLTYRVQIPYFILGEWIENPYVTATVFWAPATAGLVCGMFGRGGADDLPETTAPGRTEGIR